MSDARKLTQDVEWRPVLGAQWYEASSDGHLRSVDRMVDYSSGFTRLHKGAVLNPITTDAGYLRTRIRYDDGKYRSVFVHIIVCESFHGPRPFPDWEARHINEEDRSNNSAENLRWSDRTRSEDYCKRHSVRNRERPSAGFWISADGYRHLTGLFDHPLARRGKVAEHRKVLYDAIGPGPHPCYWRHLSGCGNDSLTWDDGTHGINVDHLDEVRLNNDLDNLVVSCRSCNTHPLRPTWANEVAS